jgi:two-component system capsular synthesis sensor histidine kinase RcsC
VVEAPDGRAALEHIHAPGARFALVISDVVMPDIGGLALARALRQEGSTLPIILISGHPLDEETDDLQALGVAAWLPKPCPAEQLGRTIAAVLSR